MQVGTTELLGLQKRWTKEVFASESYWVHDGTCNEEESATSAVWRLAWIALLMSIASAGQTQPDPPKILPSTIVSSSGHTERNPPKASPIRLPSPTWSNSYPLLALVPGSRQWRPATPAFSDNGSCIAIAGNGKAQVISNKGDTLWKWKYGTINKFIVAGELAVSPGCDAIALGGDSSYKYVWIVEKNGHKTSIPFPSTPLGLAFSRDGKSVAVGTGSARLYLFTRDGRERWSTPPYSVSYPSDIAFSPDGGFILIRECGAILRVDARSSAPITGAA
jgi:WD40 repeat protein